jgi:putative transposase
MSRQPRIHYPGALYHVIVRGNAGQAIFFDDVDRCRFCFLLQEGVERFGHRIHAFTLLTNHAHFAIQVGEVELSRIVQNFSYRHTQWINKRQRRTGHVFQGRYKARVVDADSYLVELVRYIDLNPVRAGLVSTPAQHYWGSYRAYLGDEGIPWLTTEWVLSQFGEETGSARRSYRRFISEGIGQEDDEDLTGERGGRILGDDVFIEDVLRRAEEEHASPVHVDEIVSAVCEVYEVSEEALASGGNERRMAEARALAAWAVRELSDATLSELSERLHRDLSTLSVAATRIARRSETDIDLARRVDHFRGFLSERLNIQA